MVRAAIREVFVTIILALVIFFAIRTVVHNFEVQGFSMEPSLHSGQFVIVNKASYWFGSPQRGEIVVFDTSRINHGIIHRIVGLPGELVEIRDGELLIGGESLNEPYAQGHVIDVKPLKIPRGNYFIVGDNRSASSWDIVPREDIIGKAWFCYWPSKDWGSLPNHSWETNSAESEESSVGGLVWGSSPPISAGIPSMPMD